MKKATKGAVTKTATACGPLPPDEERPADGTSKLDKPQAHFEKAGDVAADGDLSRGEKKKALETWEQDAQAITDCEQRRNARQGRGYFSRGCSQAR